MSLCTLLLYKNCVSFFHFFIKKELLIFLFIFYKIYDAVTVTLFFAVFNYLFLSEIHIFKQYFHKSTYQNGIFFIFFHREKNCYFFVCKICMKIYKMLSLKCNLLLCVDFKICNRECNSIIFNSLSTTSIIDIDRMVMTQYPKTEYHLSNLW